MGKIMSFGSIPSHNKKLNIAEKLFGWMQVTRRMQVPIITRMLDLGKDDILLDLGCGRGNFVYEMSRICRCIGVEIYPNIKNLGLAQRYRTNLNFIMGNGLNLPFKNDSLNKLLLGGTLQAITEDKALLQECHRVLKKDSTLVLTVIQDHKAIRMMYDKNKLFTNRLTGLLNLPRDYIEFNKVHLKHANMTKFYSIDSLTQLLQETGFEVIDSEFAPGRIASGILDVLLILSYGLKIPHSNHPIYFPLLYPTICLIDKLHDGKSGGNELIIKAAVKNYVEG